MTTLTKLLPPESAPAQVLLERASVLTLTSAQRAAWPESVETESGVVTFGVEERRALEVGDVFVDEKGALWVVRPAVERILHVTGDIDVMREAVAALINRGVRVAQAEDGFAVLPLPNLARMLGMVGLTVVEEDAAFDPIQFRQGGCCGGHGHGGCGCGGHGHHHHHDDEECGCGCGGHGHHHHHHDDEECGCGCGGHGHHHHHDDEECGCGCGGHGHHHHHDDEECGCGCGGHGHHHHDHAEGECCCGGKHEAK